MPITWRNTLLVLSVGCLMAAGCKEQEVGDETESEVDLIDNSPAERAAADEAADELVREAAEKGLIDDARPDEAQAVFAAWDLDKNQQLNRDEFVGGLGKSEGSDYFVVWDLDENQQLDQAEFADGLFATWDLDDDQLLDQDEYETATGDWWGEAWTYGDYVAWNSDTANPLTPEEFRAGFDNSGIFRAWQADDDQNDHLTEEEFEGALFEAWDDDDNGYLDGDEFVFEANRT